MATRAQQRELIEAGRAFFRQLAKEGAPATIYVVWGEERYLVDEAVRRLVAAVFPSGRDDFNLLRLHAGDTPVAEALQHASMMPMFAARRVVVLRGAERITPDEWKRLAAWAQTATPTTLFVLEGLKIDERLKGVKDFLATPGVSRVQFIELDEPNVLDWVARRGRQHGLELERQVPAYLVEAVGRSLALLDMAIQRASLYLRAPNDGTYLRLTVQQIQEVVPDTRTRSIFELTDSVASRQLEVALQSFRRMLEQGDSAIGTVSMVTMQMRRLLLIHEGMRRGLQGDGLARHAGVPNFSLSRYVEQARRFRTAELVVALQHAALTDRALKSSRLSDETQVERFFMALCLGDPDRPQAARLAPA